MRWTKDEQFVELEEATSAENRLVLIVSTNRWEDLPLEFKEQVPVRDTAKCASLKNALASWARNNGFVRE